MTEDIQSNQQINEAAINQLNQLKNDQAHSAQLGDAPHGVLHQPPRHPADGYLPEVASPMEENPCKGFSPSLLLKFYPSFI